MLALALPQAPAFAQDSGSIISIDTPVDGQTADIGTDVVFRGWAGHQAGPGTGVDRVVVLDAPQASGGVTVAEATYGAARPDVAAAYGSAMTNSGYTATWRAAGSPGNKTFWVYAHSISNDGWTNKTVTVRLNAPTAPAPVPTAPPSSSQNYNQNQNQNPGNYGSYYNQNRYSSLCDNGYNDNYNYNNYYNNYNSYPGNYYSGYGCGYGSTYCNNYGYNNGYNPYSPYYNGIANCSYGGTYGGYNNYYNSYPYNNIYGTYPYNQYNNYNSGLYNPACAPYYNQYPPTTGSTSAVATADQAGTVTLTWSPVISALQYRIYVISPSNYLAQTINQTLGTTFVTGTVTGLTPGQSYTFQVRAVLSNGTETPIPATATGGGTIPVTVQPPTNVTSPARTNTTVTLSWVPSTTAGVVYLVQVATNPAGPFTNATVANMSSTGAVVTGLTANTVYYFQVIALSGTTASAASNQVPVQTLP